MNISIPTRKLRFLAFFAGALFVLFLIPLGLGEVRAEGGNRAGIVVQYGDGSFTTHCISFTESQITGLELLERSGLYIEYAVNAGLGAAVCRIEADGCPASNCFCQSPPDSWSYWHLMDGAWVYSQVGISAWMVQPGSVDGWTWGPGDPPPVVSFDSICVPAEPTSTNTPQPTETPFPTETAAATLTPIPATSTPLPTATLADTQAPTATLPPPSVTPLPTGTLTPPPSDTPPPTTEVPPSSTPSTTSSPLPTETASPGLSAASATPLPSETASPSPIPSQTATPVVAPGASDTASTPTPDRSTLVQTLSYALLGIFMVLLVVGIICTYLALRMDKER